MSKQKIATDIKNKIANCKILLSDYEDYESISIEAVKTTIKAYENVLEFINSLPEEHKGVSDSPCMNDEQCDKQCELCKHVETGLKKEHKEGKSAEDYLERIGFNVPDLNRFLNDDDKSWYTVPELMESYLDAYLLDLKLSQSQSKPKLTDPFEDWFIKNEFQKENPNDPYCETWISTQYYGIRQMKEVHELYLKDKYENK